MDYILPEKYRQGPCEPSQELEKYIESVVMQISKDCLPLFKERISAEHHNCPLPGDYGKAIFDREFHWYLYMVTYKVLSFFALNPYVLYKLRADFMDPEFPKCTYGDLPPALDAGTLFLGLYVSYTNAMPTTDKEDALSLNQRLAAADAFALIVATVDENPPLIKPPIPSERETKLLQLKSSIENLWITYDNAILDVSSTSKEEIQTLYDRGQITAQQRDRGIQSVDALYQLIARCPELIEMTTQGFFKELNALSSEYSFNIRKYLPILFGKKAAPPTPTPTPTPQPHTTYAPPKKIGLSFWLLLIAAVGPVIAVAIFFNR